MALKLVKKKKNVIEIFVCYFGQPNRKVPPITMVW